MKSILISLIAIFFSLNIAYSKIENNIVVKIENEIITNFEIKNKILSSLIISNQEINQKNINEIKKSSLEVLVNYKLKKIELSKYNFSDNIKQLDSYLNSISSNNIESLKEKFLINNLDFNLFLDEVKTELKWKKLIFNVFKDKIEINENNINQEIKEFIERNSEVEEYNVSEIEIFSNNKIADEQNISKIYSEIKKTSFESSAIKFSVSNSSKNKGNIGWVSSKSLSKEIFDILKKLEPGDVSLPIQRNNSLLFLKLNDKRITKATNLDIKSLRKNIINKKKNYLFDLYSKSYLSKLKNTSYIEYK